MNKIYDAKKSKCLIKCKDESQNATFCASIFLSFFIPFPSIKLTKGKRERTVQKMNFCDRLKHVHNELQLLAKDPLYST